MGDLIEERMKEQAKVRGQLLRLRFKGRARLRMRFYELPKGEFGERKMAEDTLILLNYILCSSLPITHYLR